MQPHTHTSVASGTASITTVESVVTVAANTVSGMVSLLTVESVVTVAASMVSGMISLNC